MTTLLHPVPNHRKTHRTTTLHPPSQTTRPATTLKTRAAVQLSKHRRQPRRDGQLNDPLHLHLAGKPRPSPPAIPLQQRPTTPLSVSFNQNTTSSCLRPWFQVFKT